MRKTLEFLEFLGIYMVLAPSASEFLEFLGIYSISGGLYLQIGRIGVCGRTALSAIFSVVEPSSAKVRPGFFLIIFLFF